LTKSWGLRRPDFMAVGHIVTRVFDHRLSFSDNIASSLGGGL
jgi:hypothetical protein